MGTKFKNFKRRLGAYFNVIPDKEEEKDIIANIIQGIRFRGANLWILVLGIFLASLGLNIDSTAVVIGAMLVSPIMGPIIGMGLALGIKNYLMLRRSMKNYLVATIISVITATLYFLLTPYQGSQSELLARTAPTLYDVAIAFFGGMAGIIAVSTKGKGNVLPGVAIATALMPPLCAAGYGLATARWSYFFGAFYLFFINTVFIGLATYVGVKMLRFKVHRRKVDEPVHRIGRYLAIGVVVSLIPASIMTYRIVRDGFLENRITRYIHDELEHPGVQIISHHLDLDSNTLEVVAIGMGLDNDIIQHAQDNLSHHNLSNYHLKIVQGGTRDSLLRINSRLEDAKQSYYKTLEIVQMQSKEIEEMNKKWREYSRIEEISSKVQGEVHVLFPQVKNVVFSLSQGEVCDSVCVQKEHVFVIVQLNKLQDMDDSSKKILEEWLTKRLDRNEITLLFQSLDNNK